MRGFFDRMRGGLISTPEVGSTPGRLMETAIECFSEQDWKFGRSEQPALLRFGFGGKNANFEGVMVFDEDDEETLLLFHAPSKVPEHKRLAVGEFLTRINYGMKHGAFEMDLNDGEVRFKIATVLSDGQLSTSMVHKMIGLGFITFDRCYPCLMAVAFGNQTPGEAAKTFREQVSKS